MSILDVTVKHVKDALLLDRKVILGEEIKAEVADDVRNRLAFLDYDSNDPITLVIDSPGGSVDHGFYLGNTIASLNSPVDGLVYGRASSMAANVLQMCRKRMMLPYSLIYCHFSRLDRDAIFMAEEYDEAKEEIEMLAKDAIAHKQIIEKIYVERTGKSLLEIRSMFRLGERHSIKFTAERALEWGLIDEIVTNFKLLPHRCE